MNIFLKTCMCCAALSAASFAQPLPLYLSRQGNDAWDGRALTAGVNGEGPLATLPAALAAARRLRAAGAAPAGISIRIAPGVYVLDELVTLGYEDSGSAAAPLIIEGMGSGAERPVLSAGKRLEHWQLGADGVWTTQLPEVAAGQWLPRQLFANGERRQRARLPREGFLRSTGPLWQTNARGEREMSKFGFAYAAGDILPWPQLAQAEILVHHAWESSWHFVKELDEQRQEVHFTGPSRYPVGKWDGGRMRYLIENTPEGCVAPGDWWVERSSGVLSYRPMPGETPENTEMIAAYGKELLRLQGDGEVGLFAEHIQFRNLSFRHTDWFLGARGYTGPQAAPGVGQAITVGNGAREVSFYDCEVTQCGAYGMAFRDGAAHCLVERCHFHDLGGGGVLIGNDRRQVGGSDEQATQYISVHNNLMHALGRIYPSAIGVWVAQAHHNRITHNEICDLYYSAVSVGWTWGYGPNFTHHNLVENNHFHNIGQGLLSDMGAVYTLGVSPGTVVRGNHIHHVWSYSYGGWGLYTDEGSADILFENNLVHHCKSAAFHQHYGRDNILRNNILAYSPYGLIQRSRQEAHNSFTLEGNIFLQRTGWPFLIANWSNGNFVLKNNLYWDGSEEPQSFDNVELDEWQAEGHDKGSLLADPLFVDAEGGDYRLKPDSPALRRAFQPFAYERAGLIGEDWRAQAAAVSAAIPQLQEWRHAQPPVSALIKDDFRCDFEGLAPGTLPPQIRVSGAQPPAQVLVSNEQAASGSCSLKISDAATLAKSFYPYVYVNARYRPAKLRVAFSVYFDPKAKLWIEGRTTGAQYHAGPSLRIYGDGRVLAGDTELPLKLSANSWLRVEIRMDLRPGQAPTYDLALTPTDAATSHFRALPFVSEKFNSLSWLGFISDAEHETVSYLDELELQRLP
jgi:hypothetical protein